jgi:hypothetical protein
MKSERFSDFFGVAKFALHERKSRRPLAARISGLLARATATHCGESQAFLFAR